MNTVSLSGLHILPDDLGSEFLVTGVRPFYLYENGERTDKIGGYKYMTVLPAKGFAKADVKVAGSPRLDVSPGEYVPVRYDGLEAKLYYDNNNRVLSFKAVDVHKLNVDKPAAKP